MPAQTPAVSPCQGRIRFEQTCPICQGTRSVEPLDAEAVRAIRDRIGKEAE
jgi:hypothetical protein